MSNDILCFNAKTDECELNIYSNNTSVYTTPFVHPLYYSDSTMFMIKAIKATMPIYPRKIKTSFLSGGYGGLYSDILLLIKSPFHMLYNMDHRMCKHSNNLDTLPQHQVPTSDLFCIRLLYKVVYSLTKNDTR